MNQRNEFSIESLKGYVDCFSDSLVAAAEKDELFEFTAAMSVVMARIMDKNPMILGFLEALGNQLKEKRTAH